MVINSGKNFIQITNNPILSKELIVGFIQQMARSFTIDKSVDELTTESPWSSSELAQAYEFFYKELFEPKFTFDEWMQVETLAYGNFSIYSKYDHILLGNVDFCPDGSINEIWIDVVDKRYMNEILDAVLCLKNTMGA